MLQHNEKTLIHFSSSFSSDTSLCAQTHMYCISLPSCRADVFILQTNTFVCTFTLKRSCLSSLKHSLHSDSALLLCSCKRVIFRAKLIHQSSYRSWDLKFISLIMSETCLTTKSAEFMLTHGRKKIDG